MQGRLRHQRQRIRSLLGHGRSLLGRRLACRLLPGRRLVHGLTPSVECTQQQRPHLRREPPPHHHHAVFVLVHVQPPPRVLAGRLSRLRVPVHASPAPHDALHVHRRPRPPHRKQPLFRLRRRHTRQRPHLGVRELASSQRLRQPRQRPQCPRHPPPLPS